MPCSKCNADFTWLHWKVKCFECEDNYCSKCLKKVDGDSLCETCEVLIRRPPIRTKLMELKSKDLQSYLNKHNISTRGIVEKQELVELFYKSPIPPKERRRQKRFNCNFSGSVPNLAQRSQTYFNNLRSNAEAAFNSRNWTTGVGGHSAQTTPVRSPPVSPNGPTASSFVTTSTGTSPTNFTTQTTVNITTPQSSASRTTTANSADSPSSSSSNPTFTPTSTTSTEQPQAEASPQVPKKYPKLTDFQSLDDLNELSVKQLKELLSLNRVDYKGCVEKAELLERANRLWIDSNIRKEEVSGETSGNLDEACKICMDAPLDCVLLECGHIATCIECGKRLAECPICRQYVTRVVRTFKA